MAARSNLVCRVGIAAALAGIGRVALLRAGRSRHNGLVIMAARSNLVCRVGIAAALAGIGRVALLRAGRSRHNGLVIMAERRRRFGIGVAADGAGMDGLAALGAGCLAAGDSVGMARGREGLGVAVAAARAGVRHGAVFRAGRRNGGLRIIMAERSHFVRRVMVAAGGAGVGRIALLRARRSRYGGRVAVAGGRSRFGIGVAAGLAAVGRHAVPGAGRGGPADLLIAVDMVGLDLDDIAGAADDVVRRTGSHAGEADLRHGSRAGLDRAGSGGAGKRRAVIAAPGDLGQLPPVVARRREGDLDVAEALDGGRDGIRLRHSRAAAARERADRRPCSAVGRKLDIGVRAVVAVRRSTDLHGVKADLRAEVDTGIHAGRLAAGGPVVGGGVAVDKFGGDAVVAAVRIAGDGGRGAGGVGHLRARALHHGQLAARDGVVARVGEGLLALERVGLGRLAGLDGDVFARQKLGMLLAAARAGVDRVARVVRRGIVVAEGGNGLGVAVAAVSAGIGHAARLRAGRSRRGSLTVVVALRGRIGVDGAVGVEAAGHNGRVHAACVGAVHGEAHGAQRQADLPGFLRLRLCAGIVAPHAEHAADHGGSTQARAAHLIIAPVGGIGITIVEAVVLAEDIVEVACRVDDTEAIRGKVGRRAGCVAAPAAGPVAHDDVAVERVGRRADRGAHLVGKLDAVIEGDGCHARLLDHGGKLVDIFDEVAILAAVLQAAEAHGAARVAVVGIFVSAEVEVAAALARKVIDILLQEGLREPDGRVVRHVDGAARAVVAAVRPRQRGRGIQHRVHVAGAVQQRNDLDAGFLGRGKELVHLAFRPLARRCRRVGVVARADSRGDRVAGIRLAAHGERHVVQQEAHTVIAHREHDVRIAVRLGLIEEGLDPICRKIFSAAVQHGDLQIIAAGSERHRRQHAQQHADRQQQR